MKDIRNLKTLVEIVNFINENYQNPTAFNMFEGGKWQNISSQEFAQKVKFLSLALKEIGVTKNTSFGINSYPNPIWLMMDFAVISAGGISVPIFPNIAPQNLKFQISDANVQFIFCDKLENLNNLKNCGLQFKKIITYGFDDSSQRHSSSQLSSPSSQHHSSSQRKLGSHLAPEIPAFAGMTSGAGMADSSMVMFPELDSDIIKFSDLIAVGKKIADANTSVYDQLIKNINENDVAAIIYTSGSTGIPKGVEITHKNLVSQIKGAAEFFPLYTNSDIALSFLPLAHIFERMVVSYYITAGISIYFADDVKRVGEIIKELRPTLMTVVPRMLEKVYKKLREVAEEGNFIRKLIGSAAFDFALRADVDSCINKLPRKIFDLLVYRKLRAGLGGRFRMMICGGAALSKDMERFYKNAGFTLYIGYGATESSPVIAANNYKFNKFGTIGKTFPDIEVKLNSKGELLARGPNIMRGYHNDPKKTAEVIDKEGFLNTGDLAEIGKDGYIKIIGRAKELFKTSGGKYISPVPIEQAILNGCEFIMAAAIIAENRRFASCLLFPDFDTLEKCKSKFGMKGISDEEFLNSKIINDRIDTLINRVNSSLNHWEQIRKYYLVKDKISSETGELTPSMKLRRSVIKEKYKDVIDEFYKE